MLLSRGLRDQLAANERAARLGEFAGMLLAVLEDPAVAESVADAVAMAGARRTRRNARPAAATVTGIREMKAARLAAGRGRRG